MKEFTITKYESGLTLSKYIKTKVNVNKTFLIMMERKKLIRVNKTHPKNFDLLLNEGDVISFYISDDLFKNTTIKPAFDIIFEDDNLLIIDKDDYKKVYGDIKNHDSLLDDVTSYLISKGEYISSLENSFKPQISTRLDTNTRGLLIISKNKKTLTLINKLITERKIDKYYKAIVKGTFRNKEGILKDYIEIDDKKSLVRVYKEKCENRKEIITAYKVILENNLYSILEIKLVTGRTHQIRSHLAFYNHPVLGDNKYGDKALNAKLNLKHQELISYKLVFPSEGLEHLSYLENKVFLSKKEFIFKFIHKNE